MMKAIRIVWFASILLVSAVNGGARSLEKTQQEKIPVVQDPEFVPASQATFLEDDELVLGVAFGYEAKAYPIRILGLYEVINDQLGDKPVSPTW